MQGWGVGTGLGLAGTAGAVVSLVTGSVTATGVFLLIFAAVVLFWAGTGLVRAVRDFRERSRVVAKLPPPQPGRATVHVSLREEMDLLGEYSDSLRQLVGAIGVTDDGLVSDLRREVIDEADAAEVRLRRMAAQVTALRRSARSGRATDVTTANAVAMRDQITAGVAEYGRLVVAASDAVQATGSLRGRLGQLEPVTDRLTALTMGMRELAA